MLIPGFAHVKRALTSLCPCTTFEATYNYSLEGSRLREIQQTPMLCPLFCSLFCSHSSTNIDCAFNLTVWGEDKVALDQR
jgi:hypothetical protein